MRVKERITVILPFQINERIVDKPLRIRGVAIAAGMSRNFNIYTPEELQAFASKLVNSPVYIEHVSVDAAVGKVTKAEWDGHALWYEAEIYESETAEKIRKGLVQHVSVGADYEAIDVVDGKVPHGLHNAELSLVAVPGIPETNVQVMEKASSTNAEESPSVKIEAGKADSELVEKLVADAVEKDSAELKATTEKLIESESKLAEAYKEIEQLKKASLSVGVALDPEATMPVSEAIAVLEALLPCPAVERSTLGMMRECQEIRAAIFRLKERERCG